MACAPAEEEPTATPSVAGSPSGDACATENLALKNPGRLTVGTDSPAYEPWFSDNDPTNGKGFESAVAYAVAEELGFSEDQVDWVKVPFNNSYAPGEKNFDFDINQISITPARAKVVDFSDGYYTAAQAVVALKDSPVADATSLADLKPLKLGAQTGTTSLTAIRDGIQPDQEPLVFDDTNEAKQALNNGQLDALPRGPADRVLHHRGRDPEGHDRRPVPARGRRAGGVRHAVREGQRAGAVRQRRRSPR